MCGRYASARNVDDLASTFGVAADDVEAVPAPDWNIAPTKTVPAVITREGRPVLTSLRWGLVPSWADQPPAATLFNARIETVTDKPAFRDAVRNRRCLLPADGWYEWVVTADGRRLPHFLTTGDGTVLALAGIWERWVDAEGRILNSTAIVTRTAPAELQHVHDRAPVAVPRSHWAQWLDPRLDPQPLLASLAAADGSALRTWPVSDRVGDVSSAGPDLAVPVQVHEQPSLFEA